MPGATTNKPSAKQKEKLTEEKKKMEHGHMIDFSEKSIRHINPSMFLDNIS